MIMEDFLFYWSHRFLHLDFIYPYIHKKHHEFKDTISIASEYAHPIEAIIANIIPTSLGFKLLGDKCHLFTIVMWLALRITETIDGHSGYEFSWSPFRLLPFSGSSDSHSYHHSHNIGNYSSFFTFWDTICGTSKHY
jgi:sterol desaturase/sphingolipid hydroxylase (fatty acid hydroxylase superfamily)